VRAHEPEAPHLACSVPGLPSHTERLNTLLSVVTIASVWAWHTSEHQHEQVPEWVLAHGRPAVSVMRYRLNILKTALVNMLWSSTERTSIRAFHACAQKLSST